MARSAKEATAVKLEPRHFQLRTALLERIQEGDYAVGSKIPSEPEIAEEFGVSRMTANKAILALVADGWLYRRKRAGTFVVDPKSGDLAKALRPVVTVPTPEATLEDDYFQGLYWPLNARISAQGGSLVTAPLPWNNRVVELQLLGADPLILLAPSSEIRDDLLEIARSGTNVVVMGSTLQGYGIVAVDSDNVLGAAIALNHLFGLGHRDIAFLGAYPNDTNSIDRLRGYRSALGSMDIAFRPDRVVIAERRLVESEEKPYRQMVELLTSPKRPTAVFAAGAHIAMDLMALARSLDLRVPEDLSIVGYDDPPFVSHAIPPLTTVRQPLAEMATCAADMIFSDRKIPPADTYILFNPSLIVRGTTSPRNSSLG